MPKLSTTPSSQVQNRIRAQQRNRRKAAALRRDDDVRKENFLQRLPVEILAEILSYGSLRTVLAVSRSCKWLCTTLTHPDQSSIWKNARKRLSPPPPDPPYDVSEPAYAAVIFSVGNCPTCTTRQVGPPISFQDRGHFCPLGMLCDGSTRSRDGTLLCYQVDAALWLQFSENGDEAIDTGPPALSEGDSLYFKAPFHPADPSLFPSLFRNRNSIFVSRAERDQGLREWDAAQKDTKAFDALLKRWATRAERMSELRAHDVQWRKWVELYNKVTRARQARLASKIREIRLNLGCEREDLSKCPTFSALLKFCERESKEGTEIAWKPYEPQIRAELEQNKASHERRKAEHERSLKQVYVEAFHAAAIQSLFPPPFTSPTASTPTPVLPTLEAYRSLPSISNVIHNTSIPSKGLRRKLRTDETLRTMIKADLEKEDARLRKVMSVRLGVKKNWKPPAPVEGGSKDGGVVQHPLDRLTALFECTRCRSDVMGKSVGRGEHTSLTLEAAVRHRCPWYLPKTQQGAEANEVKNGRANWDPENFVPDITGAAVVRLTLGLAGLNEETATRKDVNALGRRWQCLTCPSQLTMSFGAIVGHAKRHKAMSQPSSESSTSSTSSNVSFSLNFIPKEAHRTSKLPAPFPPDAVIPRSKPKKADAAPKVEYGCRHCGFYRIFGDAGGKTSLVGHTPKKFCADGLASHVLRKHGLAPLRNEDVWLFNLGDEDEASLDVTSTDTAEKDSTGTPSLSPPVFFLPPISPPWSPIFANSPLPPSVVWPEEDD
ncbi:hypothetical protein M407DRAFT_27060 [Tulasnella calospora MUT 4182]|uniref:F-box domain-containing protein n=1 Tax=Tulasnella calospora MUT 4182 TaxID=1051891 RepID=A0A0C3KQ09_9AGAM|nr:hypothetical protein M407DRAFT_27060 [Tulasnella calospora MUT 4182]